MAEEKSSQAHQNASRLPDRIEVYRREIEKIVREVGENSQYEFKRSCSLQNLYEKIEFVKDIQSIATSRIETEKYLIIGADGGAKCFTPISNASEFDEAPLRQMLAKYLSPAPEFEVFPQKSSEGHEYVLIVIPRQKVRRILAKSTVNDPTSGKMLLREADLWTKGSSTGKRLAKPEDWDEIYEDVIEIETERRTRDRTAHALEIALAREKPSYDITVVEKFDHNGASNYFLRRVPVSEFFDEASKKRFQVQASEAILKVDSAKDEFEADVYFWSNGRYRQEPVDY